MKTPHLNALSTEGRNNPYVLKKRQWKTPLSPTSFMNNRGCAWCEVKPRNVLQDGIARLFRALNRTGVLRPTSTSPLCILFWLTCDFVFNPLPREDSINGGAIKFEDQRENLADQDCTIARLSVQTSELSICDLRNKP